MNFAPNSVSVRVVKIFSSFSPAGVVAELERQTQINEDIIRYMTVKVDALEEGPSVMMRKSDRDRERRGDREGRGDRPDRGERGDRPRRDFDGE